MNKPSEIQFAKIDGNEYLKMTHHDSLRPFFMSIVSAYDHWLFISSNGGLSAGRRNAEYALFPYYTDDKITESAHITGSKTIFKVYKNQKYTLWEPFTDRCTHEDKSIERNLYKSIYGNIILFEEINHQYNLTFRYSWSSSKKYGFVKKASLLNQSGESIRIEMIDGIQNILPYGVGSALQNASSHLVDAYKRNEIHLPSGLGIYTLSAIIVDKAEPSEALKANIAWSAGVKDARFMLSSKQLNQFRSGAPLLDEHDIKGEKGAYFVHKDFTIDSNVSNTWYIVANVNQNHSQITALCESIVQNPKIDIALEEDIRKGTQDLIQLVGASDGLQRTDDAFQDCRHYSNVLFNIMRGGIFDQNYLIDKIYFAEYLQQANFGFDQTNLPSFIQNGENSFTLSELRIYLQNAKNRDLIRLSFEYLPLKFSRRHGDPSRPWNRFSIDIQDELDGSKILNYEGNWRDIFQNWEALAYSYPDFVQGMIFKFLNASTFDGYNPYRITKTGFDWETIEPDDPWAYIGYWGDHQIIYLQKFLEVSEMFFPGQLQSTFDKDWFVYAAVPYKIKPYSQITKDPKDTIDFDHHWDREIRELREKTGADGALLRDPEGNIYYVNFIEKILASLLAKLTNFIPDAGIWLNTQRPEWNDANNALVGNGVSMVTLCYVRRFLRFFIELLKNTQLDEVLISSELYQYFNEVLRIYSENLHLMKSGTDNRQRKNITDQLGIAASQYRDNIYSHGFIGSKSKIKISEIHEWFETCIQCTEITILKNQRADKLFHAYNLMTYTDEGISISHLDEMLEGQVAVLSAGMLDSVQALEVVKATRNSRLYREDQNSYLLYPNKNLKGFFEKNVITNEDVEKSTLLKQLLKDGNKEIIEKDILGNHHFNGNFKNAKDLSKALHSLKPGNYIELVKKEEPIILDIFENVFDHKAFTGRSGTFYGYEGLGSIYWHMVSKYLLAVQECCLQALESTENIDASKQWIMNYYEIKAGIGLHKPAKTYGAFPTDPYSHTPLYKGAQQPGMTGQVKEDILVRIAELGIIIKNGQLGFHPILLRRKEFLSMPEAITYFDIEGNQCTKKVEIDQLFFTICQVPVIYALSENTKIEITMKDKSTKILSSPMLDSTVSDLIFSRSGVVDSILVKIDPNKLAE